MERCASFGARSGTVLLERVWNRGLEADSARVWERVWRPRETNRRKLMWNMLLAPDSKLAYYQGSHNGTLGGVTLWRRFACRKANRWKMLCADSSVRFSRKTSSRK